MVQYFDTFNNLLAGGARNERKKWVNAYDSTKIVLYALCTSDFDMTLYENEQTNRLQESLSLFAELTSQKKLQHCAFVVLLTKVDELERMLASGIQISTYWPEFTAANTADAWLSYLQAKLLKVVHPTFENPIQFYTLHSLDIVKATQELEKMMNSIIELRRYQLNMDF